MYIANLIKVIRQLQDIPPDVTWVLTKKDEKLLHGLDICSLLYFFYISVPSSYDSKGKPEYCSETEQN
jgi:hypothetical protein